MAVKQLRAKRRDANFMMGFALAIVEWKEKIRANTALVMQREKRVWDEW